MAATVSTPLTHWSKVLPLFLLGVHTALKQDLKCTFTKVVVSQLFVCQVNHADTLDNDLTCHAVKDYYEEPLVYPQQQRKMHVHRY